MRLSRPRTGLFVRFALLATLATLVASVSSAERPIVIVLSWDGVRHDYLDRAEFPGLRRIENDGLRAERLIPIFPSSTFPNHAALATGTYADRHGIVANVFRDSERGTHDYANDAEWFDAEPLWVTAERQRVRAAVYFWVGSETDWHGIGATYRKVPFDSDVGESEKVAGGPFRRGVGPLWRWYRCRRCRCPLRLRNGRGLPG